MASSCLPVCAAAGTLTTDRHPDKRPDKLGRAGYDDGERGQRAAAAGGVRAVTTGRAGATFGELLRGYRAAAGLSQEEVAERAGTYRPRACYAGVAEFSVYVARASRGRGAGQAVLAGLIEECARRGFWTLVSRIFPENMASRALCRRLGFRDVGLYRRHGQLDGAWRDCVIVERILPGADDDHPGR